MEDDQARAGFLPGILATVGGAIVLIACFLTWGKVSAGQSGLIPEETGSAFDFEFGWYAIGAGVVLLGAGILWLARRTLERPLVVVAIVAALIPIAVAGYNIATKDSQVDDALREGLEESTGRAPTDQELDQLKDQLELLGITVTLEFGIYLTVVGGLIGLGGALLGLRSTTPEPVAGFYTGAPPMPQPADAPAGEPGPPPAPREPEPPPGP